MTPEDAEAAKKELIRSIPTDREAVFAYPVKWDAFDAAAAVLQPKLSAWINKKIKDLLGVEEATMVCTAAANYFNAHLGGVRHPVDWHPAGHVLKHVKFSKLLDRAAGRAGHGVRVGSGCRCMVQVLCCPSKPHESCAPGCRR